MDGITYFPIIFIHYGDSEYLRYTINSAKVFNPFSRVILLGDKSNQHYIDLGIEHFFFENYSSSPEIILFKKVYQFIGGINHGRPEWTQFVFQRWFHIFEFIQSQSIEQFWTFDSDNLILADLHKYQDEAVKYDCTEQCNSSCMNGFVGSSRVVRGYVNTINSLFLDKDYLEKQAKDFIKQTGYAFTEMRAYDEYRNRNNLNTIRLQKLSDGETFDECLCQPHEMEFLNGKKKLFLRNGSIYQKQNNSKKLLKVNTINMSWTDIRLIEELFTYAINNQLNIFPKQYLIIHCSMFYRYAVSKITTKIRKCYKMLNDMLRIHD